MKRLLQFSVLAAFFAVACAGCGDNSKPVEPKVTGGNPDPNLKRVGNNSQGGGGGKAPAGGGAQSSSSPN